ncbi:breast cancer type 2 susceptibility protein isoform X2 [Denticeps clupeoides]|uniref:breast cancer type 2 susceptibility protein isoform X2 n=1 Tax=Denticeps clupeoides TaxID=299321 RepID=UPI0010A42DEF|nr:breast cancer type 2 susceptibility protein homolog isoform X2 [Denticeps clupeoides]
MFEEFVQDVEDELGPLNPDWFEELTAKAAEDNGCDGNEEDHGTGAPCAQGIHSEPLLGRPTPDSQMFSTPKIFRRQTDDNLHQVQQTSPSQTEKSPWTDSSPCFISDPFCDLCRPQAKKGHELPDTPATTMDQSAKRISESLGADMNPDISWTSSLNTPSLLSPTVLLCKKVEQTHPASITSEKHVIFVRRLFPSVLMDSESKTESRQNDRSTVKHDGGLGGETECPLNVSFEEIRGGWKQKVPAAIEDGEVRNTVENVLDGAEDVLSFLFSNSNSTLRRVRSRERIKRRNPPTPPATSESQTDLDAAAEDIHGDTTVPSKTKSPLRAKDCGMTQWSPLSISQISDSYVGQMSLKESVLLNGVTVEPTNVGQSMSFSHDGQKTCPNTKPEHILMSQESSLALSLSKKPRKFVYSLQKAHPTRETVCDNPSASTPENRKLPHKSTPLSKGVEHAAVSTEKKSREQGGTSQTVPSQYLSRDHDVDMTQLCRAFAEDFSQESILKRSLKSCEAAEDRVCGAVSKQNKKVAYEAKNCTIKKELDLHNAGKGELTSLPEAVDAGGKTETPNLASAALSHIYSTSGSRTFSNGGKAPEVQSHSGFKTASDKIIPVPREAVTRARASLDEYVGGSAVIETRGKNDVSKTLEPTERNSDCQTDGIPERKNKTTPEGVSSSHSPYGCAFKTASNRKITLSSVHIQKAKEMFKDLENEDHVSPSRSPSFLKQDLEPPCTLTASQRADVTELCSLLEEAGSQFDFTQAKNAKFSSESQDEWDPEFLADINFDDSFSSNVEKRSQVKMNTADKHMSLSDHTSERDKSSDGCSSSRCLRDTGDATKSVGFKSAPMKAVHTSEENVMKARDIFSDLDEKHTGGAETLNTRSGAVIKGREACNVPDHTGSPMDNYCVEFEAGGIQQALYDEAINPGFGPESVQSCHGFSTAAGKKIRMSQSALLKAKRLLGDCDFEDAGLDDQSRDNEHIRRCAMVTSASQETIDSLPAPQTDVLGVQNERGLLTANGKKSTGGLLEGYSCRDDRFVGTCANKLVRDSRLIGVEGFKTASGKGVAVSTKALQQAKAGFKDCGDFGSELNVQPSLCDPGMRRCGFTTAGGKRVLVSEEALMKARSLMSEVGDHDSICSGPFLSGGFPSAQTNRSKASASARSNTDACRKREASSGENGERALKGASSSSETGRAGQGKSCGFSTASGKRVSVSESALQKARTLLDECRFDKEQNMLERGFGFSTASAKEVFVSEEAKGVFDDSVEPDAQKSQDPSRKHLAYRPELSSFGYGTVSGKGVPVSKEALQNAVDKFMDCSDEPLLKMPKNEAHESVKPGLPSNQHEGPGAVLQETKRAKTLFPSGSFQGESSLNDFKALGLSGCTITQQKYLQQEAMACTKALLEDEDLHELCEVTSDESPMNKDAVMKRGQGKWILSDNHPPLKRRLLAEFDRTTDSSERRALNPAKTCPSGVMQDRRVFRHKVPLQPNITHPNRTVPARVIDKSLSAAPEAKSRPGKPSTPRMPVFVPPFHKHSKTGAQMDRPKQETRRAASLFVPPFKKNPAERPLNQRDCNSKTCTDASSSFPAVNDEIVPRTSEGSELQVLSGSDDKSVVMSPESPRQSASEDVVQLARDLQDMRIRKKNRQTVRPLPGSLFLAKTPGLARVSLLDAVGHKCPAQYTEEDLYKYGVHRHVSRITSSNAEHFRFRCDDFFKAELFAETGSIQLADGGWLVPDVNKTVGKEEFYRALCDTPGVDPKLISDVWVHNHYRWIVWKRASMERAFPMEMGSLCLTPEQVLLQLKYRYDVEIDNSKRPALRKIMERDDTPAKTLVLCVCGIVSEGCGVSERNTDPRTQSAAGVIWLTDGWYAIRGLLDTPLTAALSKGRLPVGGKLVIHGAELVGSHEACSPLEAPDSLMLKISANGTRHARWDSKLGFYRDPRPFQLPLSTLYSNGGPVGCVDILVLRSYPTQWMEKTPNGTFIFRNERAEEKEVRRHEDKKHKVMEVLFAQVQEQFEKKESGKAKSSGPRRSLSRREIESLQDGEELHEATEGDPVNTEARLSEQQLAALANYRRSLEERKQARLQELFRQALMDAQDGEGSCPNREVNPVWKLCVCDCGDAQSNSVYILNIWRPSLELRSLLKEGKRYKAYHLSTSEGRKRAGSAALQLSTTKKTQFQHTQVLPERLQELFTARVCVLFKALQNPAFCSPCSEVDIVGCVISIVDQHGPSPVLYLADEKMDFVSVRCCSTLPHLAVEDMVKPQVMLALKNAQIRRVSAPIPALYAGDLTLFSANSKDTHLQERLAYLRNFVLRQEHFIKTAEEKLFSLLSSDGLRSMVSPKTPSWKAELRPYGRPDVTPQQPMHNSGFLTPLIKRTPQSGSTSEGKDQKSLKRKRGLEYLSRIPSPPPLNPLGALASPRINKTFHPPRRSEPACSTAAPRSAVTPPVRDEWVNDEELAMIDTQALLDGLREKDRSTTSN